MKGHNTIMDDIDALRDAVAAHTGVPTSLLGNARTAEQLWDIARAATEWKAAAQPARPATATLPASTVSHASSGNPLDGRIVGPPQVSHSELVSMDPAARMAAWKAGQLESLGVGPYRPVKRTGH